PVVFYSESGEMNLAARRLLPGDRVTVYGGIGFGLPASIKAEKLEVNSASPRIVTIVPRCPRCQKNMKSKGRGQKYQCVRCGELASTDTRVQMIPRKFDRRVYMPPVRRIRHLMKPPARYGREKLCSVFERGPFTAFS
ncbi:MAG: hypothetical protein QW767_02220, partial [Thermoprotei archaeon]